MDEPAPAPVRQRWRAALVGSWAVAAVLAICAVLYLRDARQIVRENREREVLRVRLISRMCADTYREVAIDSRILAQSESLAAFLDRGDPAQLGLLSREMLHLEEGHPEYFSVRYIDEAGRERARADAPAGVVPAAALQDRPQRPFVQEAADLPAGECAISPLELISHDGVAAKPATAVVRFIVPIFDARGRRRGMIVIDYRGERLLATLDQVADYARPRMRVLDASGYWIHGAAPADDWGRQLPGGAGRTLARTAPALWSRVSRQPDGQAAWRGGWFTWEHVVPTAIVPRSRSTQSFLVVASEYSAADIAADLADRRRTFALVGAVLFVAALGVVGFFDSRQRERRRAEEALRLAGASARESARLKARFLANMSHEIRTPMNGVIGMTNILLDTPLTAEQRSVATIVRTSAESLLAIINDILDFSKIEAGQLTFRSDPFDLRNPVENCLRLLAERARMKGIELAYLIEENVPTQLIGDEGRLHQVLVNLVGNALKYTERGEVVLRIYKLGDENRRARLHFVVRDTGIGIAPETQAKLFQPFVQGDGGAGRQYGGTGLGLAISRQLVTMMGGEIGLRSEPGRGSSFWFTAELPIQEAVPKVVPLRPGLAGRRALIVDDNATNREILARQLSAWKVSVQAAPGAAAALEALRAAAAGGAAFHFAVLDMRLEEGTGLDLARSIAADPTLAGLKTIILSSIGRALSREEMNGAGVAACLAKPVRQTELHDALAGMLPADAGDGVAPTLSVSKLGRPADVKLRILVAEDNLVNQHVARLQLQQFGYEADVVAGGGEAVAAVREKPYDVILMDCQMPDVDGFEAARRIRAWEASRGGESPGARPVFIVAMTANAMTGDRDACLAAGMNDYVTKPVQASDLAAALARAQMPAR